MLDNQLPVHAFLFNYGLILPDARLNQWQFYFSFVPLSNQQDQEKLHSPDLITICEPLTEINTT